MKEDFSRVPDYCSNTLVWIFKQAISPISNYPIQKIEDQLFSQPRECQKKIPIHCKDQNGQEYTEQGSSL